MQSKLSKFFKSSSDSTPPPAAAAAADDGDHDLANWNWENNQHHIINTYTRTRRNPNPIPSPPTLNEKPIVVKNKKRSYAQFHLELGQSDFLLRACSTCGIEFTPGDVEDEKLHAQFHKRYTQGIQFRVTKLKFPFSDLYLPIFSYSYYWLFILFLFRVGVMKGLFLRTKVVELFWCWIMIHLLTETRFFIYLLLLSVNPHFLWFVGF